MAYAMCAKNVRSFVKLPPVAKPRRGNPGESRGQAPGSKARPRPRQPSRNSDEVLLARMADQERMVQAIDAARLARGVSQRVFCAAAHITERRYRDMVAGRVLIRAATLAKLKRAYRKLSAGALT